MYSGIVLLMPYAKPTSQLIPMLLIREAVSFLCGCYLDFCIIHILNIIDTGRVILYTEEDFHMYQFHVGNSLQRSKKVLVYFGQQKNMAEDAY